MRRIWAVVGSVVAVAALGSAHAELDPERTATDRAQEALAEGDPGSAARTLAAALGKVSDPAAQARLRCRLGRAWLAADRPEAALTAVSAVPIDAPCGRGAAWSRVEALRRLGRVEEGAKLAAELGEAAFGEDREGVAAESFAVLARRLIADPERGRSTGLGMLAQASQMAIAPARRAALADEVWDAWRTDTTDAPHALCSAQLGALDDGPERLLRAVWVCGEAEWLATGLPAGPARDLALARGARGRRGSLANAVAFDRALGDRDDAEAQRLRAQAWSDAMVWDARSALRAAGTADGDRAALGLAVSAERWDDVVAEAEDWLGRWAWDPHRAEVETLRAKALLASARSLAPNDPAAAVTRYDALRADHPTADSAPTAAWEAGVALRASGDPAGARARWEAARATYPETGPGSDALRSLARSLLVDEASPDRARDLLRSDESGYGSGELDRMRAPAVSLRSEGAVRGDPVVHLQTRNLDRVEIRVHEVDPLAWVRAGRDLDELDDLDVAAIAADRTTVVEVPDPKPMRDTAFDVVVKVGGPGLYAITAASDTEEASILVSVSDLRVVTRTVGDDTVVAVFDDRGEVVRNARVVLSDGHLVEGKTDASGMFLSHEALDPSVLVERGGAWALVPRSGSFQAPQRGEDGVVVSLELERADVLPGASVGYRLVARKGGRPVSGRVSVWLDDGPPVTQVADAEGAVWGELPVPLSPRDPSYAHPQRRQAQVSAMVEGDTSARSLATLTVAERDASAWSVEGAFDGWDLVLRTRDAFDLPAAGVPFGVDDRVVRTDAAGRASVRGPRPYLSWWTTPALLGSDVRARFSRPKPESALVTLRLEEDVLRSGEAPRVHVRGDGPATLAVFRRMPLQSTPPDVDDPFVQDLAEPLSGWHRELGDHATGPAGVREKVSTADLVLGRDGSVWSGDPLPPGQYEVVVSSAGGRWSDLASFAVDDARLRIAGARTAVVPGDTLRLVPEGSLALVTAEGDGILWAGVRAAGRPAEIPVDAAWRGQVRLAATPPGEGLAHVRTVEAAPDPEVVLTHERRGDHLVVRATVRDALGRPVDAAVAFAGWDPRTAEALKGSAAALDADVLYPVESAAAMWGDGGPLRHGAAGEPIAPALLAENELRRERERARDAGRSGLLSDNALAEAMMGDVPIELGGGAGYGMGHGSFGSKGEGGIGAVGGSPIVLGGRDRPEPLAGHRDRVVWRVVRSVGGVAEVELPPIFAPLVVRATAVTAVGAGSASTSLDGRGGLRLVPPALTPGSPEDEVQASVAVINESPDAVDTTVVVAGGAPVAVHLDAGARVDVPVGALRGGQSIEVRAGALTTLVSAPLFEGLPDDDGAVTAVAAGERAFTAILTRAEVPPHPVAFANLGRAAVAAWRVTKDPALLPIVRAARAAVTPLASQAPAETAALLLAASSSGAVGVPANELGSALDRVEIAGTPAQRLRAAAVLAEGGRPPSSERVDELLAAATDDEAARWAVRLRRAVGRPPGVTPVPEAPPMPGEEALVDWIEAHAGAARGAATVGGRPVRDGVVEVFAGAVTVSGPAFAWRAAGVSGSGNLPEVARVPAGTAGSADPGLDVDTRHLPCDPCRLQVGDRLSFGDAALNGAAGVGSSNGRWAWMARAPGTYLLPVSDPDRYRPVRVIVGGDEPPMRSANARVNVAWWASGRRAPEREAGVAGELEDAIAVNDPAAIAAAALAQRDAYPGNPFHTDEIVRIARALDGAGEHALALEVWRAAADVAFGGELAAIVQYQSRVGELAVLQRAREAIDRSPHGPTVGNAAYLLPGQLLDMADNLPPGAIESGITPTDVRLTAAAWDRELLATFPDHPATAAAGLRLGRTLLELHAPDAAAEWARRVRLARPGDDLSDALMYLEATAWTEAGRPDTSEPLLRTLADGLFERDSGPPRPSEHATEARLALARLFEARGQWDRARAQWKATPGAEGATALAFLDARSLEVPSLARLAPGESSIEVVAEGVESVAIRAYRVDLRTLFLRDGGLDGVHGIAVDGVSPQWTLERRLKAGPFPETHRISLPLDGIGAWLVQFDAGGTRASTLVVRSDLALGVTDADGQRRVDVRRGGVPASGVEVRGLEGGLVYPAVTDIRGVATLPASASILAWAGDSVAFTDPDPNSSPPTGAAAQIVAAPVQAVDQILAAQQGRDQSDWHQARSMSSSVWLPSEP